MRRKSGNGRPRYRVSPNVVAFWTQGAVRLVNFATRQEVRAEPIVAYLVAFLGDWRDDAEIGKAIGVADLGGVRRLIDRLVHATIVQASDVAVPPADRAMAAWTPWNPAAGFFHAMSSHVTYVESDAPAAARATPRRSTQHPVKRPGVVIGLAKPDTSHGFPAVLVERRTWRRFAGRDVPRIAIDTLLWLTAGVQGWLRTPRREQLPLTTSPSGGARHPIELYALARHVEGIRPGLYRYDGRAHTLRSIGPPPTRNRTYLPRQHWYEDAAFIVFFCARFQEILERYPYPRAYRAVLLEAGHVCQTFCLTATWQGLAPFCTMALDERRIERDLGLDGISVSVLYAAGVGVRPTARVPSAPRGQRRTTLHMRKRGSAAPRGSWN